MQVVEFPTPVTKQVSAVINRGICTAKIYANERAEERRPAEDAPEEEQFEPYTVYLYDTTTIYFTPGKMFTVEEVKAAPEVFVHVEGDLDKMVDTVTQAVQDYIDGWAKKRGYDNCFTASGYKDSTVLRFQMEGTILSDLRDDCWKLINILEDKAKAGDLTALSDLMYLPAGLPEPDFSDVPEIVAE